MARSGQESLAQGLPWVIPANRISPEGATSGGNWLRTFEPDRVRISSPFRAKRNIGLPRVNPGLSSLAPSGRAHRAI